MSLQTLSTVFQQQASSSSPAGLITINQATLDQASLTYPAGLDQLIAGGYALPSGQFLQLDTTGFPIPAPVGNTLTVQGFVSVLNLSKSNTQQVKIVFTADNSNAVTFTIQIDLSSAWTFATSFEFMNAFPFTGIAYTSPSLIFSSQAESGWQWQSSPVTYIALAAGQNFAAWTQMSANLQPYAGFLSGLIPSTNYVLSGPFDLSKYAPNDQTNCVIYPDLDLNAPITGISPVGFSFFNVSQPSIGLTMINQEETEDGVTVLTQTPEVYFQLMLNLGSNQLRFRSGVLPKQSGFYVFSIDSATGLSPQDVFQLAGGQNYTQVVPVFLQQFFSSVVFKGLGAIVSFQNGKVSVQSVSLQIGANVSVQNPWSVFGFKITLLDLYWKINYQGTKASQSASLSAEFYFLSSLPPDPNDVFPGPFNLSITSDMVISGGFDGTVSLTRIVAAASNNLIQIPPSVNVTFSDFSIQVDLQNNSYQFSGLTEVDIDLFGNNKFMISGGAFYLTAVYPANGQQGSNQYTAGISGTIWINSFGVNVSAAYEKGTATPGWVFTGSLADGVTLNLGHILDRFGSFPTPPSSFLPLDLTISNVSVSATVPATGSGKYSVSGQIEWKFNLLGSANQPIDIIADISVTYDGSQPSGKQFSGYVEGTINIESVNVDVIIRYDFSSGSNLLTLKWEGFTTQYDITKSILIFHMPSWNLGQMITGFMRMVSSDNFELEAPWDLLNSIDLPALDVTYDFGSTPSTVIAQVTFPRSINLVFAQIDGIKLTKNASGTFIAFTGTYQGQTIGSGTPLDGDNNVQNLPAPAGQGNKFLDLRLLAMGQHVTIQGYDSFNTVDEVIQAMKDLTNPVSGNVPVPSTPVKGQPLFNEASNWLIATDMGILKYQDNPAMYTVELEIVFNDPTLYGLRLSVNGDKIKFLSGLSFEIMYKKITDSIGMYKAELTLPSVVRTIELGAFSITLPTFGIEVYTNGDFKVDIGFPHNLDFSKSFTFQAIIMGVPVMGSGGLYFGKLSSATSNDVPVTTLGQFNPIMVFGLGMQLGLGKSINYGVLKAGFSITIVGIIEGVVATWHPYNNADGTDGEHYVKVSGSIGILGLLYGTVDFAIIKANVNVKVYVTITATYESYRKIPLVIEAGVEVDVDVKIDLGLFSITISFSFHMRIREELTIGSDSHAPWDDGQQFFKGALAKRNSLLALSPQLAAAGNGDTCQPVPLTFKRRTGGTDTLQLWFAPHMAYTGNLQGPYSAQQAQYVAMFYVPSPNAKDGVGSQPTDFENLANRVFAWVLAAMPGFNGTSVSDAQLCQLYATLTQTQRPIQKQDVMNFLQDYFENVNIQGLNATPPGYVSFFPMFPDFSMSAPPQNGGGGASVDFNTFTQVDGDYLNALIAYFQQLEVQVANEENGDSSANADPDPTMISIAQFVFEDYFTMIARQMVQSGRDCLRKYEYPLQNNDSLSSVADTLNAMGNTVSSGGLALANAGLALANPLSLTLAGLMASPVDTDSAASIAQAFAVDVTALILQNQLNPSILQAGKTLKFQQQTYTILPNDTFSSIATALSTSVEVLAADTSVQTSQGIYIAASPFLVAGLRTTVLTNDSPGSLATRFGATAESLLLLNALMPQLLSSGQQITYAGITHTITPADTITTLAAAFSVPVSTLVADSGFQSGTNLLLPLAAVLIPAISVPVQSGDTIQVFADRFGVNVNNLFSWYANAALPDIFASSVTLLQVPQLAVLSVDALNAAIKQNNAVASLAGMISRFHLHGLRLPTSGIQFENPVTAPCAGQPDCGLYALTGQQFALPVFKPADTYQITITKSDFTWILFNNAAENTLVLPIGNDAVTLINTVLSYAQQTGLNPQINSLGPGAVYREDPKTFNFSSPISWQAAGPITLPNDQLSGQLTPQLRMWAFPDNLMMATQSGKADASYSIRLGSTNEISGSQTPESQSYSWSTLVGFTIRKLAVNSGDEPATEFSYQLVGATQTGIVLLERLLSVIRPAQLQAIDNMRLLYSTNPTGQLSGLLSDDDAAVAAFLTQSNLSTFTNPEAGGLMGARMLKEGAAPVSPIRNNFYEFIKMLWEASITRSGGFYLYYNQQTEKRGLPDAIFDGHGEATLQLLITYTAPSVISDYMNYAITGDSINSGAVVYANSEQQLLSVPYDSKQNLDSLTSLYNATVLDIGEGNDTVPLSDQLVVALNGIAITAGPAGSTPAPTLEGLTSYFNVTAPVLQALNPQITAWEPVPLFSMVLIPNTQYTVSASALPGNTLQSIAAYFRQSVGELAWNNRFTAGLFAAGSTLTIDNQLVQRTPLTAQGNIGLEMLRTPAGPVPATNDPGYAKALLENLYSMLAFSLVGNSAFTAASGGLPASPSRNLSSDELQSAAPKLLQSGSGDWDFRIAAPVARYAISNPIKPISGLPSPENNPYAGVGDLAQINLAWADYFGNYTASPLTIPTAETTILNNPIIPVGYTDTLLGLSAWPGISMQYGYGPGTSAPGALTVNLHFDPTRYQEGDPDWLTNAQNDIEAYTLIYYQINQTYVNANSQTLNTVTFSLDSTLNPSVDGTFTADEFAKISSFVNAIYTFLNTTIVNGEQVPPLPLPAAPDDISINRDVITSDVNPASVFELTVTITMERDLEFVHPEFRDQPQVVQSVTEIKPPVVVVTPAPSPDPDASSAPVISALATFATAFESAFAVAGSYQLKLSVGVDKEGITNSGSKELWVVRIGLNQNQSIYFNIPQTPQYFSLPPLSNKLESHQINLYPYVQEQGIDYTSPSPHSFTGIDMDVWAQNFLQALDNFLTPAYSNPAFITDLLSGAGEENGLLSSIRQAKETIAGAIVQRVDAIFKDDEAGAEALADAQEALRQQLLVLLSNAYSVSAIVQYPTTASTNFPVPQQQGATPPRLYGTPDAALVTNANETDSSENFSLTSAKIQLPAQGDSTPHYLTFLLSAKDVRLNADLNLSVTFDITHVEFEIEPVQGIENYTASSWLAFVLPANVLNGQAPLTVDLGNADVPLVLRAYPTPPTLNTQVATGYEGGATAQEQIANATAWDFGFSFSHDNAAQDIFYGRMDFNIAPPPSGNLRMTVQKSLFETLGEFINVYPAVLSDLQNYLCNVTMQSDPQKAEFKTALGALTAFEQLVTDVAASWAGGSIVPPPKTNAFRSAAGVIGGQSAYPFKITQSNDNGLLLVTLNQQPAVDNLPVPPLDQPVVNIPGYTPQSVTDIVPQNQWHYRNDQTQDMLEYTAGLEIPDREIDTPGLNVLQYQNAKASVYLTRNEVLTGLKVKDIFVYTTPMVSFPNNLVPLLNSSEAINLAGLMQGNGPWPLWTILQSFFQLYFAEDVFSQQNIMVECRYRYPFPGAAGLPDVELPVLFVPPTSFLIPGDYQPSGGACEMPPSAPDPNAAFICRLAYSIITWWNNRLPDGTPGYFVLDVSVFSELDDVKLPLSRLRQVVINLSDVQDIAQP